MQQSTSVEVSGRTNVNSIEQLRKEIWFHGPISRAEAERLLQRDGDFLVRESTTTPGQFVLSGMQDNNKKHLLLIDPEGVVSFSLYCLIYLFVILISDFSLL